MTTRTAPASRTPPGLFWPILCLCVVVLAVATFRWELVDALTQFLEPLLELLIGAIFIISMVISHAYVLMRFRTRGRRVLWPLGAQLATVLLLITVPFTDLSLQWDFLLHASDRQQIVAQIEAGELRPNVSYNAHLLSLPPGAPSVSAGGNEILVEQDDRATTVLFFTFRGVLGHASGFVYRSDDAAPPAHAFNLDLVDVVPWQARWFWISAA